MAISTSVDRQRLRLASWSSSLPIMKTSFLTLAISIGSAWAWLPQDRDLEAFNQTARFEQLGKRWEPSLPSGINKIRGVNFGGKSADTTSRVIS